MQPPDLMRMAENLLRRVNEEAAKPYTDEVDAQSLYLYAYALDGDDLADQMEELVQSSGRRRAWVADGLRTALQSFIDLGLWPWSEQPDGKPKPWRK
jgi:hypothetical protein